LAFLGSFYREALVSRVSIEIADKHARGMNYYQNNGRNTGLIIAKDDGQDVQEYHMME
jgi:hypothetical protein